MEEALKAFRRALEIAKMISSCSQEMEILGNACSGSFVPPGPSGAITRGKLEILPTGRNFYTLDPRTLPTPEAWEVGKRCAEKLLEEYLKREGKYPESVGQVLWSIDAYKGDGEQLAQILYLLGTKPKWGPDGTVRGIEIIPLEELGRPRIDCIVRISGIVRDTLPRYVELIDEAVEKVISLEEPPEKNFPRKHFLESLEKLKEIGVRNPEEVASARVFGSPPGSYGAGVNLAVEASAWKTQEDLAKIWIKWSGYAYKRGRYGFEAHEGLTLGLKNVEVVNRNHISDEHDLFACCCYFGYHGGFIGTVKAIRGKVLGVTVDTRDPSRVKVREISREIERVVRAKLLNPVWIEEMKKHGYRGANEFEKKILHLYGWAATSREVENWIFDKIAEKYVLDDEMRRFFREHNIWALEEITRRLLEAAHRKIWKADEKTLKRLNEIYSEIEGILEEEISCGDFQGGSTPFISFQEVPEWGEGMKRIEEIFRKVKGK